MKQIFRMRRNFQLLFCMIVLTLVSGCMYPDDQRAENRVSPSESVFLVQHAVEEYHKATGVLPIKNSTMDTPIYEKYILDFRLLKQKNLLSTTPANAFENGGTNYYVLINVEQKPEVKLLDLISMQQVADLRREVEAYQAKHSQKLPLGDFVASGFYQLDFSKMGKSVEQVKSVYSDQYLSFLIHETGEIVIDYAPEIMKMLTKLQIKEPDPSVDLRKYLVAESYYVPAKSYPYYWVDKQPQIAKQNIVD